MRAYKPNSLYYQINFWDNRFHINWATERGRRKEQFCISSGIDIKREDWEKYNIVGFLDKIYKFYDKLEERHSEFLKEKLGTWELVFKRQKELREKLFDKTSNKIKKFLIDNNINYKL